MLRTSGGPFAGAVASWSVGVPWASQVARAERRGSAEGWGGQRAGGLGLGGVGRIVVRRAASIRCAQNRFAAVAKAFHPSRGRLPHTRLRAATAEGAHHQREIPHAVSS